MSAIVDPRGHVEWPECIGGPLDGDHYSRAWARFVITRKGSRIFFDDNNRLARDADSELVGFYLLNFETVPWHYDWYRFESDESQADGVR